MLTMKWNSSFRKQQMDSIHSVSYTHLDVYKRQVKGYENGTREIYVADENGPRKLTKDEELSNLDAVSYTHLDVYKRQCRKAVIMTSPYMMNMAIRSERQNGTGKDVKH